MLGVAHELFFLKLFVTLIVFVNPLETLPVFLHGARDLNPAQRRHVSLVAATALTIILSACLLVGTVLLTIFTESQALKMEVKSAEQVLGKDRAIFQLIFGTLVLLLAIYMVFHKPKNKIAPPHANFAVVPLAFPIMAGPGTLAATVLYAADSRSLLETLGLFGVVLAVGVAMYLCLRAASALQRHLTDRVVGGTFRVLGVLVGIWAMVYIYSAAQVIL